MSHRQQQAFFALVADHNRELVRGGRILEIGAYDVNGSMRAAFAGAAIYVGVDLKDGPGVDVVAYGHQFRDLAAGYQVVVSGECFEHDPHWVATFQNMVDNAVPGGLVAFSCAARGRAEHGTRRANPALSPGTQDRGHDYYQNRSAQDFERQFPLGEMFAEYRFWYDAWAADLYFAGVRQAHVGVLPKGRLPTTVEVRSIRRSLPFRDRFIRLPLRVLARILPEGAFQQVAVKYWPWILSVQSRLGALRHRRWRESATARSAGRGA